MPKPKSLGERLFEIVEAEASERWPARKFVKWRKEPLKAKKRFQTIAERFASELKQEKSNG
jgi:hypothetical protein